MPRIQKQTNNDAEETADLIFQVFIGYDKSKQVNRFLGD